jgi:hypothetical protein
MPLLLLSNIKFINLTVFFGRLTFRLQISSVSAAAGATRVTAALPHTVYPPTGDTLSLLNMSLISPCTIHVALYRGISVLFLRFT